MLDNLLLEMRIQEVLEVLPDLRFRYECSRRWAYACATGAEVDKLVAAGKIRSFRGLKHLWRKVRVGGEDYDKIFDGIPFIIRSPHGDHALTQHCFAKLAELKGRTKGRRHGH